MNNTYTQQERIKLENIWFDEIEIKEPLEKLGDVIDSYCGLRLHADNYSDMFNSLDFNGKLEDFIYWWAKKNIKDWALDEETPWAV